MKEKKIKETIELPENVTLAWVNQELTAKGPKGETSKKLSPKKSSIEIKKGIIEITGKNSKRKTKAEVNAIKAHIKNIITGVTKGFTYTLATVYSHFPITVKTENNFVTIKNFTGRKKDIKVRIIEDTKVEVKGKKIIVSGLNKENVGQTASNLEKATKAKNKDLRVYQDGIYIVNKQTGVEAK